MDESFGSMLRRYRVAGGFTQEALAERAAISPTAIAALERGRRRAPRLSTLRQIARALDLSPEELAEMARAATADMAGSDDGSIAQVEISASGYRNDVPPRHTADLRTDAPVPGTIDLPHAAKRRWRADFVGRNGELEHLRASWASSRRFDLVLGESGVGKTRLLARIAEFVQAEGAPVLWGRCTEERLGPYSPFVEVLRQIVSWAEPSQLAAAVGNRGEITRLVPEFADKVGPLPAPTRAEAGTEQRLLFESVATLLGFLSPLLLVLDDLHWADEATMALLAYLVRSDKVGDLVIVGAARDSDLDPMSAGYLAELGRLANSNWLTLDGLGAEELSSLVSSILGSPAEKDLVDSIRSATDGNPFFVEEMTVHLIDSEIVISGERGLVIRADPRSIGVPQRIRDTLIRRLLSLSQDAIELLSAGSLIGREFEVVVAAAASDLDGQRLVEAADDALLSGLVVESSAGRLSFSHALVQNAVEERLSFPRKASVHRRVAEVLEDRWGQDRGVVAELARHWAQVAAFDRACSATAAIWAVRAGDVALASAAADEAIARYEQASQLWAASTAGHADTLIRLGRALQYKGRADDADEQFRKAMQLAVVLGQAHLQASAAIGLGRRYSYWETDQERIEFLEDALTVLPEGEGQLRPTIMAMLVTHLIAGFNAREARHRDELAAQVRSVAVDPSTPGEVLLSLGQTRIYDCFDDPAALYPTAERLVTVAQNYSDLRVLAGARFAQALAALDDGDMSRLRTACDRYADVAYRLDDPRERGQLATARSTVAFIEGSYSEASEASDEALELGRVSGDLNAELVHYAQGILRAVDLGQAREVLPLLVEATQYQNIVGFAAGTALCAALAGDHERALAALDRFSGSGFDGLPRGADWLAPTAFLAHACYIVGARKHAALLLGALDSQPSLAVRVGPLIGWWGPVDHHLGCLWLLSERYGEAEKHLMRALALEEQMGALPFAARTLGALAALERKRDNGSTDRADEHTDKALELAGSLGSVGVEEEVMSGQR
jgi:transcriptional regulator with XRE-family HTH domain/tetratricopeptide (TPR) repeat protein